MTTSETGLIQTLYDYTRSDPHLQDPETAHLTINGNHVLGMNSVPGLNIDTRELEDGIDIRVYLEPGTIIKKQVHMCFGMLPETGIQRIVMDVNIGEGSKISFLAHCVFPKAVDVEHIMNAQINIGKNAEYTYYEKHVHSPAGGVRVRPKAEVHIDEGGIFKTEFELIQGRVGLIDIDYEAFCEANSILEMDTRISGQKDDLVKVREIGHLNGEYARGVLTSKIAVRDKAKAEVYNKLSASAAYARGHVDCKEIVRDDGEVSAIPIVEVNHPKAHITHEAAIGSVDHKQLETLMSRGLDEDQAVELIISGMLSRRKSQ